MSVLRGTIIPRILLGIIGVLALVMAWGSIESMLTYGPSVGSVLLLVFAVSLALICLSVAIGWAPFRIRE
jgi:hypothetical protein